MERYNGGDDMPSSKGGLIFNIFILIILFTSIAYFYFKIVSPTSFSITPITTTPVPIPTTTPPPTTTIPPTTTPAPLPSIPSNYVLIPDGTYNNKKLFTSGNTTFQLDAAGDLVMRYNGNLIWTSGTKEGGTQYTILNGVVTLLDDKNTNIWSSSTLLPNNISLSPKGTYATYLIDAAKLGIVDTSTNTIYTTYLDGLSVVAVPNNSFECDGTKSNIIQLGYCQFTMQVDGNFVIYVTSDATTNPKAISGSNERFIWSSGSNGTKCKLEYLKGALYVKSQEGFYLYIVNPPSTPPAIDPQLYFKNTGQIITIDASGVVNILVDASANYYSKLREFTF
jgi:hypothetical protein